MFREGHLAESQFNAERGSETFLDIQPDWGHRFLLLEAESMSWRGMNEDVLHLLSSFPISTASEDEAIRVLSLEAVAFAYRQDFKNAWDRIERADRVCATSPKQACGELIRAKGVLEVQNGRYAEAHRYFSESLQFARAHNDGWLETTSLLNLGAACLEADHPDEAIDWSNAAYRSAVELHAQDVEQNAIGNLGWAYFKLGDFERARDMFRDALKSAVELGDTRDRLLWLSALGYLEAATKNVLQAQTSYQNALEIAKKINSKEDLSDILTDLGQVAVASGKADEADAYARQAQSMAEASGNKADWYDDLAIELQAAALRGDSARAESLLKDVEAAPESQTSMKWASEHAMAQMHERRGELPEAGAHYQSALAIFAAARAAIRKDDSGLPFLTNATRIYDDYIHFLIAQGKTDEALAVADESRAQTLAQGLGLADKQRSLRPEMLRSGAIARRAGATVLFYWLGERQSYLWAIAPGGTHAFTLPAQSEIAARVNRYRQSLLNSAQADTSTDGDGAALYRMLVEPAAKFLRPGGDVAVVCDGPLSLLNFETLVVPSDKPHYWIEDANITSAPSLYMLASAHAAKPAQSRLLLLGDAVSPNPDYPDLPMAGAEMKRVSKHFDDAAETVYARGRATADAYLKTVAQSYSYIHFVAHGVASRTEPLDSAIILSRTGTAEDSFKLHARDIIQHPINAQLVTISACYGGGTRSYAGEGLVGLSWAFLRAGAHNVIGALWEASDDSTPQLMDSLYAGVQKGLSPSVALRQAKLEMLHSDGRFRQPFYWAPFQIYSGL